MEDQRAERSNAANSAFSECVWWIGSGIECFLQLKCTQGDAKIKCAEFLCST